MQELELTTYKDRWIHVEVSAQSHTSTDCRLVAAYGRHLGFALFCQALTAQLAPRFSAQACSAKTGEGLEAGMQKLMEQKAKQ